MDRTEALKTFAKYIKKPCTTCGADAEELCDTSSVWVHLSRLQEVWDEEKASGD